MRRIHLLMHPDHITAGEAGLGPFSFTIIISCHDHLIRSGGFGLPVIFLRMSSRCVSIVYSCRSLLGEPCYVGFVYGVAHAFVGLHYLVRFVRDPLIALLGSLLCWEIPLFINAWFRTMSRTKYSLSYVLSLHPSRKTLPP